MACRPRGSRARATAPGSPTAATSFPAHSESSTRCSAEPGNLWFEWSRSVEDPSEFVLVEGFTDHGAGPHVNSEHFERAVVDLRPALASTPRIVSRQVEGASWDAMGEITLDEDQPDP